MQRHRLSCLLQTAELRAMIDFFLALYGCRLFDTRNRKGCGSRSTTLTHSSWAETKIGKSRSALSCLRSP